MNKAELKEKAVGLGFEMSKLEGLTNLQLKEMIEEKEAHLEKCSDLVEAVVSGDEEEAREIVEDLKEDCSPEDIEESLEVVEEIEEALEEMAEQESVEKCIDELQSIPVKIPERYKHSEPGVFEIEAFVLPAGESFTPSDKQMSNPRFAKRFNHAVKIGALVKV